MKPSRKHENRAEQNAPKPKGKRAQKQLKARRNAFRDKYNAHPPKRPAAKILPEESKPKRNIFSNHAFKPKKVDKVEEKGDT